MCGIFSLIKTNFKEKTRSDNTMWKMLLQKLEFGDYLHTISGLALFQIKNIFGIYVSQFGICMFINTVSKKSRMSFSSLSFGI